MNLRTCKACKRNFKPSSGHLKCPKCRDALKKRRACAGCGLKRIREDQSNHLCLSCVAKGSRNHAWKGGRTYHKKGYRMVLAPGHPRARTANYVFEHILVMEEHLGRHLALGENVHHKNGVKDDNRLENLELWQRPQPAGARVSDLVDWATTLLRLHDPERLVETLRPLG